MGKMKKLALTAFPLLALAGLIQSTALAVPPDTDGFLAMLNSNPFIAESEFTAKVYYATVDPDNKRKTLRDWQNVNGFGPGGDVGADAFAIYINDADLGFARRMYLRTKASGDIASCVENYLTIDNAKAQNGVLATVCMEWGPAPDGSGGGRRYTKFYTYDENNNRALGADLDGRGFKYQPGLCMTCHGGFPKGLEAGGYPDHGDVDAFFLPWDLDTFVFSQTDPNLSRAAQEGEFKKFNQAVLSTYPAPATFRYTGPAVAIPDDFAEGVDVSLVVSGGPDEIGSLVLSFDGIEGDIPGLEHPRVRDIQVWLTSPQGTSVALMGFNKNGANLRNTYLHDKAEKSILSFQFPFDFPPYTGTYMPFGNGNMASFIGENPNGTWKITVKDLIAGNSGAVHQWSLYFNGEPVLPVGSFTTVQDLRVPAPVELIEGWYGGSGMPSTTFDGSFVPVGWLPPIAPANAAELYLKVVGPTCRACHIQRGTLRRGEIDFSTYADFLVYADRIEELVYRRALMPLAKRTFDHFWDDPERRTLLAQHLPDFASYDLGGDVAEPGVLIVDAGSIDRIAPLNRAVILNGEGSQFAETFTWSLFIKPAGSTAVIANPQSARASFMPDLEGEYSVQLIVTGNNNQVNSTSFTLTVSAGTSAVSYKTDIQPILSSCSGTGCHAAELFVVRFGRDEKKIWPLVDPVFPRESLLLRKPSAQIPHAGSQRPGFAPTLADYETILRWIQEGICGNGNLNGMEQCGDGVRLFGSGFEQ